MSKATVVKIGHFPLNLGAENSEALFNAIIKEVMGPRAREFGLEDFEYNGADHIGEIQFSNGEVCRVRLIFTPTLNNGVTLWIFGETNVLGDLLSEGSVFLITTAFQRH